jgi:histidinol dehydrogenase
MADPARLLHRLATDDIAWRTGDGVFPEVSRIVERVRNLGDRGLAMIAAELGDPPPREVPRDEIRAAYETLPEPVRAAIEAAAKRIERFARAQRKALSDVAYEVAGFRVGHRVMPVARVGTYVPGGRHPLPSSLLMTATPARVAGVAHITVCTPNAGRETLAAAHLVGVDRIFELGGAQAIAALAFGTESVPRVDLIAGPGGAHVTAAKRFLFGTCGIDILAGPSEVCVIASGDADPSWIAADLLAQAEHDVLARVLLMTDDAVLADRVDMELSRQLDDLVTAATARVALERQGCCAVLPLTEAIAAANVLAPEHLLLHGARAEALADLARAYGSLFIGARSAEVFGDYGVGPNHVLPTSSTARFTAGVSVFTFLRACTFIQAVGPIDPSLIASTALLADREGLVAHRQAALTRSAASCSG